MLPLADVTDPMAFGGKAVALGCGHPGRAARAGRVALSVDTVEAVVRADPDDVPALHRVCAAGGPRAVRSSAVGEDSAGASFAGAHCTVLGVCDPEAVVAAVRRVHASADAPQARAYRAQLGLGPARMGVVVQELVARRRRRRAVHPQPGHRCGGAGDRGELGAGRGGRGRSRRPRPVPARRPGPGAGTGDGEKDVAVRAGPGGAREIAVDAAEVHAPCLDDAQLAELHALAEACDAVYGTGDHDIEFAFHAGAVFLLQRRPITGG